MTLSMERHFDGAMCVSFFAIYFLNLSLDWPDMINIACFYPLVKL